MTAYIPSWAGARDSACENQNKLSKITRTHARQTCKQGFAPVERNHRIRRKIRPGAQQPANSLSPARTAISEVGSHDSQDLARDGNPDPSMMGMPMVHADGLRCCRMGFKIPVVRVCR